MMDSEVVAHSHNFFASFVLLVKRMMEVGGSVWTTGIEFSIA